MFDLISKPFKVRFHLENHFLEQLRGRPGYTGARVPVFLSIIRPGEGKHFILITF